MILEYDKVQPMVLGHSQKGQDSLIKYTFDQIGTTNKYYVEYGAVDGYDCCNTAYLRNQGWTGLLLEGNSNIPENPELNLHIRSITKDNICDLYREFNVPVEHDFACIDLDSMDYWITDAMLNEYRPRVVMVETNVRFTPYESWSLKYDPDWRWDGGKWYGASPYAFKKMLNAHGYTPVWVATDDMIAIRDDVLAEAGFDAPSWDYVYPAANPTIYDSHVNAHGQRGTFNEDWIPV